MPHDEMGHNKKFISSRGALATISIAIEVEAVVGPAFVLEVLDCVHQLVSEKNMNVSKCQPKQCNFTSKFCDEATGRMGRGGGDRIGK